MQHNKPREFEGLEALLQFILFKAKHFVAWVWSEFDYRVLIRPLTG